MGRAQGSSTPVVNNAAVANRHASSPAPKATANYQIPPKKKSAGIVIKNPTNGDIVTFEKSSTSPAPPSKSPAAASTPTPPPRAPSHTDTQQPRTENRSAKTDDQKRKEMKEKIAKKMEADRAEEQRKKDEEESKAAQEKKDSDEKLLKEQEEADAKEREAAEAQLQAEEAAQKEMAEAEIAKEAAAKAKEEADEAAEKARKAQELEDEYARLEAEYAEMERKEKEAEERYAAKKKVEQEEAARKEAEAFKMADEEMKRAELEDEEAEEARLKEIEKSEKDSSQKERADMFAQLKKAQLEEDGSPRPTSDVPAAAEETPVDSGVATPASDAPAPATSSKAANSGGKQKPKELKIDTAKPVEPAQPSAQLRSLRSARRLMSINDVSYPAPISSPNPALNTGAPTGRLRYNKEFLLQFQRAFIEKPSENWTERVKETVGDTSEPSSARTPARGGGGAGSMMTGRQPSNRAPMQQQMGAFGQGGRTLPPNTTSSQRFEASTAIRNAQPPRQAMQNPLASLVHPSARGFPTPTATTRMDRTPSSTSLSHPISPRNASQRGGSQRGSRAAPRREDPKDNKAMPLTAGVTIIPF